MIRHIRKWTGRAWHLDRGDSGWSGRRYRRMNKWRDEPDTLIVFGHLASTVVSRFRTEQDPDVIKLSRCHRGFWGVGGGSRTRDILIHSQALYP